jgi:hypothetical protein
MATDPQKSIPPSSQTGARDDADATPNGSEQLPDKAAVDRAVRDAAMNAMQTVRAYHATKAA